MVFFNFFNFIANFFGIFNYASDRNEAELYFLFSLFLILYRPILAWNEAIMVSFNFLNFLASFMEFSITRRVGKERNDNFYFLSFSYFSGLFCWKWSHNGIFQFFQFLCYFFGIFCYASGRNGTKRNDNFHFLAFSSVPNLFWLKMNP